MTLTRLQKIVLGGAGLTAIGIGGATLQLEQSTQRIASQVATLR